MKISLNWLKDYIRLNEDINKISDTLTSTGLEVASVEEFSFINEDLVIGHVITCEKHPNAEKLKITTVDIGNSELLSIVCGAPNVAKGQKVIVAPVGTTLTLNNGDKLKLKKVKIRGEISEGMICAEDEIGLSDNHDSIIELKTDLKPGSPASMYFKISSDHIIDVETTPNRTDAFSHIGVAIDLGAALDKDIDYPKIEDIKKSKENFPIEVKILDSELCKRYSGIVISGIKVKESPIWLRNKLSSIGVKSINNIVDITNFVLHETGQPLHAFDYDKIKGNKIIVKQLKNKIKFITLDQKERSLSGEELMICDNEKPLCIAGILGGNNSGVTDNTTKIFLESAYFKPDVITKASKLHDISTDASFRFERGTDPNNTINALKRAANLIVKESSGIVASDIIDFYPNKIEGKKIKVFYKNIHKLIGNKIDKEQILTILKRLEIKIIENKKLDKDSKIITEESKKNIEEYFTVLIPTYRGDVTREIDVIEEILRIYGYNNIKIEENLGTNFISPTSDASRKLEVQNLITQTFISIGYNEIVTNSLTNLEYSNITSELEESKSIKIINPLSENLNSLRQSLLFSGLEAISNNIKRGNSNIKFFEFGKVYKKEKDSYIENQELSIWITGNSEESSWIKKQSKVTFQDINSIATEVLIKLGFNKIERKSISSDLFTNLIQINKEDINIALIGKVSDKIIKHFDINQEVFYATIKWDNLLKLERKEIVFSEISKFPSVSRDLSLILDKKVLFEEVKKVVSNHKEKRIISTNIYDVYEGDKLPQGKKTYTLNFILQDQNKTLKDKEIDKMMNKLMLSFENELGAEIKRS